MGMLEECVSYLDACIYNTKTKKSLSSQDSQSKNTISERIKRYKYECKTHIQLCALLSQLGQHELALTHGKQAVKKCEHFMNDCYILCSDHLSRHRQKALKPGGKKLLEKAQYMKFHDLVLKAQPNVEFIVNKLKNKRIRIGKTPKLDMRTVLGVQRHNDWIHSYNIGDMMLLHPMSIYDLQNNMGVQAELTRDWMLEKILMIIVAYFCVATEIRFLAASNSNVKVQANEGKLWHKKALEFSQPFLPTSCPLFLHIMNSYMRNYSDGASDIKGQGAKGKKMKNKTPNPEMKRPRSTSNSRVQQKDERPSTANFRGKKKPSPRVGDFTPPARTVLKNKQFNFNSPTVDKITLQNTKAQSPFSQKPEENSVKGKLSNNVSSESEVDQDIVISSYDLYGINSDEESQESEESHIDSTGGKLSQEPVIISATGGNSCLFKS